MTGLVAVIDIGKTNKKIIWFDDHLRAVGSVANQIPARVIEGVLCEDIERTWSWICAQLKDLCGRLPIAVISVVAHGSCVAVVDADDQIALPVIAYDHELSADEQHELDGEFVRLCGPLASLQAETGSCELPKFLNAAKAMLFAQRRWPSRWARVHGIIDHPQYWGLRLTGCRSAEATAASNHTFLLDIHRGMPSNAARALGLHDMIDTRFRPAWDLLGEIRPSLGLPALPVVVGMHDSNAALLPYLIDRPFEEAVVLSTGTWCVAMRRVDAPRFAECDIGRQVLFNIDAFGRYLKVAMMMGGEAYSYYHRAIGGRQPEFSAERLDAVLADVGRAFLPGGFPGPFGIDAPGGVRDGGRIWTRDEVAQGQVPHWFRDPMVAHDLLIVSLALQCETLIASTGRSPTVVYVEGGWRDNPTVLGVLAALMPESRIMTTTVPQATAAGGALLGLAFLGRTDPRSLADPDRIALLPVEQPNLRNLSAYRSAWLDWMG